MKKSIILFILLWLPFLAAAQWTVNLKAGAGTAKEFEREVIPADPKNGLSYSFFSTPGYSYFGGVDVNYFFSQHLGLSTGLAYSFSRSRDDLMGDVFGFEEYWISETIKTPVSLLWSPGNSGRSIIRVGFSAEINLRHQEFEKGQHSITYRDNPFFLGFHLGYEYGLSKRFRLGILLNTDMTYFLNQIEHDYITGEVFINYRRYYFTSQITLSYQLFGSRIEKP